MLLIFSNPAPPAAVATGHAGRSADDYAGAIRALLPRGRVWRAEQGSTQQALIGCLSKAWARLDIAGATLLGGSLPGGNLDLVPEWEETLGLPDPCAGIDATLDQRATQVLARFVAGGGQSIPFFVDYAATLGFDVSIFTFAPFRVDLSTVETPLYDQDWFFAWHVYVILNHGSLSGDVLACELRALKPAQTYVFIS